MSVAATHAPAAPSVIATKLSFTIAPHLRPHDGALITATHRVGTNLSAKFGIIANNPT